MEAVGRTFVAASPRKRLSEQDSAERGFQKLQSVGWGFQKLQSFQKLRASNTSILSQVCGSCQAVAVESKTRLKTYAIVDGVMERL